MSDEIYRNILAAVREVSTTGPNVFAPQDMYLEALKKALPMSKLMPAAWKEFEEANTRIEPMDACLGISDKGKIVMGAIMPDGKLLTTDGDGLNCPWLIKTKTAIDLITAMKGMSDEQYNSKAPEVGEKRE